MDRGHRMRMVKWRGGPGRMAAGVTFLEIMIVIVIIGILLAVVGPRMKGTSQRAALVGAAREILAACNLARQSAISTQREAWIRFDVNGDRWRVVLNIDPEEYGERRRFGDPALTTLEEIRTLPPKVSFIAVVTPEDAFEEIRGDKYPLIVFNPDGSATDSYVVLGNERGRQMTVQVSAGTGRAEVFEGGARTFAERLAALGVDPSAFATEAESLALPTDEETDATDGNQRSDGRSPDDGYIQDVLNRIAGARGWGRESRYGR